MRLIIRCSQAVRLGNATRAHNAFDIVLTTGLVVRSTLNVFP